MVHWLRLTHYSVSQAPLLNVLRASPAHRQESVVKQPSVVSWYKSLICLFTSISMCYFKPRVLEALHPSATALETLVKLDSLVNSQEISVALKRQSVSSLSLQMRKELVTIVRLNVSHRLGRCPDGSAPPGACINGLCGLSFSCVSPLNICCLASTPAPSKISANLGSNNGLINHSALDTCPNGQPPIGACINGQCGGGLTCITPANLCCSAIAPTPAPSELDLLELATEFGRIWILSTKYRLLPEWTTACWCLHRWHMW